MLTQDVRRDRLHREYAHNPVYVHVYMNVVLRLRNRASFKHALALSERKDTPRLRFRCAVYCTFLLAKERQLFLVSVLDSKSHVLFHALRSGHVSYLRIFCFSDYM